MPRVYEKQEESPELIKRAMLAYSHYCDNLGALCGISTEQIKSRTRKREVVELRQMAHYLTAKNHRFTLKTIGKATGGYDHSTIIHSIQLVDEMIETRNKSFRIIEKIHPYRFEQINDAWDGDGME
jgi:chromosomal replication initiation ATPase DnaA